MTRKQYQHGYENSAKPVDTCWCNCHTPIDEAGRRQLVNEWPKYFDVVGIAVACVLCKPDHEAGYMVSRGAPYLA